MAYGLPDKVLTHLRRYSVFLELPVESSAANAEQMRCHRTVAFRIVQEALANVARHAGAGRVEVTAGRDGECQNGRIGQESEEQRAGEGRMWHGRGIGKRIAPS